MSRPITPTKFYLANLWPDNCLHLIAGPSGSSKTTWLFQFLDAWVRGKPGLGLESFPCYPTDWIYIASERSIGETFATIDRVGAKLDESLIVSWDETKKAQNELTLLDFIKKRLPRGGVAFLDGLQYFSEKYSQYEVKEFLRRLRIQANELGVVIVGIVHTPKLKEGEGYLLARERISGSGAWGACSSTIFLFEPLDKLTRRMYVLPKNYAEFDVKLELVKGKLVVVNEDEEQMNCLTFDVRLIEIEPGSQLRRGDVVGWALDENKTERTAERWINSALKRGKLKRDGRGLYTVTFKQ